jgi:hypothetical protein
LVSMVVSSEGDQNGNQTPRKGEGGVG